MALTIDRKTLRQDSARGLGCFFQTTLDVDAVNPFNELTVTGLRNFAIDDEKMIHWYVQRADGQWRLITDTTLEADGKIQLASGFPDGTGLTAGSTLDFYMVLSPDEWNFAIQEVLQDKYRKVAVTQALTAGETEYDLSATFPWLQHKGQIIRVRLKSDENDYEEDVGLLYIREDEYSVTMKLPAPADNFDKFVIEAKRYYEKSDIDSDADTIKLPGRLAKAEIRGEALELIFQTLGPAAKRIWGASMAMIDRKKTEQNARWQQDNDLKRDYMDEDFPFVGDAGDDTEWGWG